jgi:Transglycosylase SLT domain
MLREAVATMAVGGTVGVAALGVGGGWSSSAIAEIPAAPMAAYEVAPEGGPCPVAPASVAAVYAIESGHGTYGGATVDERGDVRPVIRGPRLDGSNGHRYVPDTDDGRLDGDELLDRAMGPGQFIPTTWAQVGTDGNGDGVADPDNLADAAAATVVLLCEYGYDITDADARRAAFGRYHGSGSGGAYASEALELEAHYAGEGAPSGSFGTSDAVADSAQPGAGAVADELVARAHHMWLAVGDHLNAGESPSLGAVWTSLNAPLAGFLEDAGARSAPADVRTVGSFPSAPGSGTATVKADGDRRLASVPQWWDDCRLEWPGPLTPDDISRLYPLINAAFGTDHLGQHRALADRNGPGRDPCSSHLVGGGTDHGGHEEGGELVLNRPGMAALASWAAERVGAEPHHPFVLVQYWNRWHYGHHVHLTWNPNYDPDRYPLEEMLR